MQASTIRQPSMQPGKELGSYPTPVRRLRTLEADDNELWLKDDGLVNARYGGNKVRKLELILERAQARGARRIVTAGTAGSHHALATALFGAERGFRVAAALCPQVWTPHAEETLRASLAAGIDIAVAHSMAEVPLVVARKLHRGDFFVPPGGASVTGARGYLRAVGELIRQIERGELPEPDVIVVAVGSGSTIAGLAAGVVRAGLKSRVVGVTVTAAGRALLPWVLWLANRTLRRDGAPGALGQLKAVLDLDDRFRGRGYGVPSEAGAAAAAAARSVGLSLDPTYTEKAFAAALGLVGFDGFEAARTPSGMITSGRPFRVLYWHTLSAAPLGELVQRSAPRFYGYEQLLPRL